MTSTSRFAGPTAPVTLFVVVFVGTLLVSLVIREILLPYVLPQLHAGNGFFVGGDSVGFHDQAVALAAKVRQGGWSNWTLSPAEARTPLVGITAAIYAILGPSPLWLLPVNALIHALSAVLLFFVMRQVFRNDWAALAATAPFVLMPTAAYWYSQLHKDGIFILGAYAFLAGWVVLGASRPLWSLRCVGAAALLAFGTFLMWFVRSYSMTVLLGVSALLATLYAVRFGTALFWGTMRSGEAAARMLMVACLLGGLYGLVKHGSTIRFAPADSAPAITKYAAPSAMVGEATSVFVPGQPSLDRADHSSNDAASQQVGQVRLGGKDYCSGWRTTVGIPSLLDSQASSLIRVRNGYYQSVYAESGSTIDRDYCIVSFKDFLSYLPRAIQVGFLAPFPYQWLEKGVVGGSAMRRIAGVEMLLVYAALALALGATIAMRGEGTMWTILFFAGPLTVLYAIVTPNVGALHRMRYGFLMLLVGLGTGWLVHLWTTRGSSSGIDAAERQTPG